MLKTLVKSTLKTAFTAAAPLASRKSAMTAREARALLEAFSPRPTGTALADNRLTGPVCDLQIVIPAYNVQEYLPACLESVLSQQTNYTYRVLLVDDGSTDDTPAIADRYASDPKLTVIHQENRGFSGARNRALEEIFARYVMFVDSDDLLCPGAVESLLLAADSGEYDIAEAGAYYLTGEEKTVMYAYSEEKPAHPSAFHGQPWAKVYKAALFADLKFPEGFWYEDSILAFFLWDQAKTACTVPAMAYVYRRNPQGITAASRGRPKAVDTYWITEQLNEERKLRKLPADRAYFARLLDQIRLNHYRIKALPEKIQEAVFVLTCRLMEETFGGVYPAQVDPKLEKALKTRDFGAFRLICKLY